MALRTGRDPGAGRADAALRDRLDGRAEARAGPGPARAGLTTRTGPLRAGVIGLGVGAEHLEALRAHPGCAVEVICDQCPSRLAAVAASCPDVDLAADAEAVLADPDVDMVVIASYDDCHAGQVLAAIQSGKHVFVEKPLCQHEHEAQVIRAALRARPEVRLSSNLILRRSPRFRRLRELIRAGRLGELYHLEAAYHYGRLHKLTDGWRGRRSFYSVMLGGGVHMIDLLIWLTGRRVVEVASFGNRIASRGSRFRFDDLVTAVLQLDDGATAQVTANFGCVRPHGHGLTVYGTEATFVNDADQAWLHRSREPDATPERIDAPHPGAAKGEVLASFADAILAGDEPEIPAGDVFDAVSVALAVDRATVERRVVAVDYL